FVSVPAQPIRSCDSCGGASRRLWSPVGLVSSSQESGKPEKKKAPSRMGSLCATNPDVPGLCHMSESAGRAWIARYRGDGRALDKELERQEKAAAISPPTREDAVTHSHFPASKDAGASHSSHA